MGIVASNEVIAFLFKDGRTLIEKKGNASLLFTDRLFDAASAARVELSRAQQAHVNVPYITADQTGPKHLDVALTRARIDRAIEPLLRKVSAVPCSYPSE